MSATLHPTQRLRVAGPTALVLVALGACAPEPDEQEATDRLAEVTIPNRTARAYEHPLPGLNAEEDALHRVGDRTFDQVFVTGGDIAAGLGPDFNNSACGGCHISNGRGLPVFGQPGRHAHALVRVSLSSGDPGDPGGSVPVPGYGGQLQDLAIWGVQPEVSIDLAWEDSEYVHPDGQQVALRRPRLTIEGHREEPLPDDVLTSMRLPPPVFGAGLLEAVTAETLEAMADPEDIDGDGISGRVNHVWDPRIEQFVVGRFGWKANTADLELQSAAAYFNDMGITSRLIPGPDDTVEVSDADLDATVFYVRTLAVPQPNPEVPGDLAAGRARFTELGCASCHRTELPVGESPIRAIAGQRIAAYTDLLLHDMGEGLADGRGDFEADGREWRTTALWGAGLAQTVLPGAGLLHDGRARTLEEAILWHGGEAQASRDAWASAPRADRDALVAFLRSL